MNKYSKRWLMARQLKYITQMVFEMDQENRRKHIANNKEENKEN